MGIFAAELDNLRKQLYEASSINIRPRNIPRLTLAAASPERVGKASERGGESKAREVALPDGTKSIKELAGWKDLGYDVDQVPEEREFSDYVSAARNILNSPPGEVLTSVGKALVTGNPYGIISGLVKTVGKPLLAKPIDWLREQLFGSESDLAKSRTIGESYAISRGWESNTGTGPRSGGYGDPDRSTISAISNALAAAAPSVYGYTDSTYSGGGGFSDYGGEAGYTGAEGFYGGGSSTGGGFSGKGAGGLGGSGNDQG